MPSARSAPRAGPAQEEREVPPCRARGRGQGCLTERSAVLVETWLTNERKRVSALMDPLLMMVVGGMVLVIVLAILLPIFDLQASVG